MTFGQRLRDLRSTHGISLRALADRTHYSRSYLHDLETGRKLPPPDTAARIDDALGAGGGLAATLHQAGSGLPDWAGDRIRAVLTGPHRPDPTTVDHLAQALTVQRHLEDSVGARPVLAPVLAGLTTVAQIRASADGELHDQLLSLESQYAQFAGWLHQDLDHRGESEQWYARALTQAHEAGDDSMVASILSMRANAAWGAGDPRRSVRLAEASCRQHATPGVLALSQQHLARGLAAAGDRDGCLRALDRSEQLFAQAQTRADREPAWIYFVDESRMRVQRALCLRDAGDHQASIHLFEQAIRALPAGYARDRGTYTARLAVAYALAGERDAALAAAAEARHLATATGSERALAEVRRAVQLTTA